MVCRASRVLETDGGQVVLQRVEGGTQHLRGPTFDDAMCTTPSRQL
jgi:hypothetical protein